MLPALPVSTLASALPAPVRVAKPGQRQILERRAEFEADRGDHTVGALTVELDDQIADHVDLVGVVSGATFHAVGSAAAAQRIVAAPAVKRVVVGLALDRIVSGAAVDQVAACTAGHIVVARARIELVVTAPAAQRVEAGSRGDQVRRVSRSKIEALERHESAAVAGDDAGRIDRELRCSAQQAEVDLEVIVSVSTVEADLQRAKVPSRRKLSSRVPPVKAISSMFSKPSSSVPP